MKLNRKSISALTCCAFLVFALSSVFCIAKIAGESMTVTRYGLGSSASVFRTDQNTRQSDLKDLQDISSVTIAYADRDKLFVYDPAQFFLTNSNHLDLNAVRGISAYFEAKDYQMGETRFIRNTEDFLDTENGFVIDSPQLRNEGIREIHNFFARNASCADKEIYVYASAAQEQAKAEEIFESIGLHKSAAPVKSPGLLQVYLDSFARYRTGLVACLGLSVCSLMLILPALSAQKDTEKERKKERFWKTASKEAGMRIGIEAVFTAVLCLCTHMPWLFAASYTVQIVIAFELIRLTALATDRMFSSIVFMKHRSSVLALSGGVLMAAVLIFLLQLSLALLESFNAEFNMNEALFILLWFGPLAAASVFLMRKLLIRIGDLPLQANRIFWIALAGTSALMVVLIQCLAPFRFTGLFLSALAGVELLLFALFAPKKTSHKAQMLS